MPLLPGIFPSGDGPSPDSAGLGAHGLSDDLSSKPSPGAGGPSPPGGAVHENAQTVSLGAEKVLYRQNSAWRPQTSSEPTNTDEMTTTINSSFTNLKCVLKKSRKHYLKRGN